jgi:recombinational DNA repair protein RecT
MATNELQTQNRAPAPATIYRQMAEQIASNALQPIIGSEAGKAAAAKVAMAFAAAAAKSKDPSAYYNASPASVGACIAASAETGLMPGGALPDVYLVPRQGGLDWTPTARGLMKLAREAGYEVRAVLVGYEDTFDLLDGEVANLLQNPDTSPGTLEELRGIVVYVRRAETNERMAALWVPVSIVKRRASAQGSGPVWKQWPMEMALKSAIRYCFARGYIPIQGAKLDRALTLDAEATVIEPAPAVVERPTARAALGLSTTAPAAPPTTEPEPTATEAPPVVGSEETF